MLDDEGGKGGSVTASASQHHEAQTVSSHRTPGGYRVRGLDGLRAIAAIAVLTYHFLPTVAPGGFLGVDVFFVLSGFLITGLLLKEQRLTGRIDLKAFWVRRIRRLFPAVTFVVLVITPLAMFVHRDLTVGIGTQIFGVLTFSYNWVEILSGSSYFEQNLPHVFTNVWSLGVEEQFYLTWPIIVIIIVTAVGATRRRRAAIIPVAFGLLSAAWMAYLVAGLPSGAQFDPTRAYMGTDSHAFGLMLGAALAFFLRRPLAPAQAQLPTRTRNMRGYGAWAGLAVVMASFFLIPDSSPATYPYFTLITTVGVVAFLQGCVDEVAGSPGPAARLMSIVDNAVFRWLGVRSYGIYLWHWPILVVLTTYKPSMHPVDVVFITTTLSVGLAAFSFRFIETPMRRHGIFATLKHWAVPGGDLHRPSPLVAVPALFLIVTIPATVYAVSTAPKMTSTELLLLKSAENESAHNIPEDARRPVGPVTGKDVLIIGDSLTLSAKPQLEEALPGIIVDADVSRSIYKAVPIINHYRDQGVDRQYIVLSLATNSVLQPEQFDDIMDAVGTDHYVLLVNAYGPASAYWIEPANKVLQQVQRQYPDQVRIADWHDAIAAKPDLLAPDHTHPKDVAGLKLYATTIKDGLKLFSDGGQ